MAGARGIDYTTISKYENNKSQPDNEILRELADLYEVTLDWLISGQVLPGKQVDTICVDGVLQPLSRDEALHLVDSLEMYRLLRAKREKDQAGKSAINSRQSED